MLKHKILFLAAHPSGNRRPTFDQQAHAIDGAPASTVDAVACILRVGKRVAREVGWLTVPQLPLPTMLPNDALPAPPASAP
jgi:hypothetical protein